MPRQQKVLVVDDDVAIRVLLETVLTRINLKVAVAEDGEVALEKLRMADFDLVLLDLMMPKINGYDFLERLHEETEASRLPHIIVFTAAGKRGAEKIPPNRICQAVLKPFDLRAFIEMIGRCLNGGHERIEN